MKKNLLFIMLNFLIVISYAQTDLKLEIIPKQGQEPKLNRELRLEAWLTNTSNEEIKVFMIGRCEYDWKGYQGIWKMYKDGVEVKLYHFRDGATSRFSEKLIINVKPGEKIYAGLFRKNIEAKGIYRIEYELSASPKMVNYNYAANSNAEELAKQICEFSESAVFEFDIKGLDFDNVKVKRTEISPAELKNKPTVNLVDAFSNPSEVYKLKVTGKISEEDLAQIYKFQNVRELELSGLEGITELPVNLSELDLIKVAFSNLEVSSYPTEYAKWKSMTLLNFQQLRGEFPTFIYGLNNLEILNIGYLDLTEIPKGFGNLKKLEYLNITDNGQPLKINKDIAELPALLNLSVFNSKLNEFPPVWGSKNLKKRKFK